MIDINTPADLESKVMAAGVALLDFWAPWCGPCKSMLPALEQLQQLNPDLVVAKVNIDENKPLAQSFGLRSVPTLVLFKDGQVVRTVVGAQSLTQLQHLVDAAA